jgi:hypothetical protein
MAAKPSLGRGEGEGQLACGEKKVKTVQIVIQFDVQIQFAR